MAAITRSTGEDSEYFINHLDTITVTTRPVGSELSEDLSPAAGTEVAELEEKMAGGNTSF